MTNAHDKYRHTAAVAAVAIIVATAACGVRTPPRPPEYTEARPPGKFAAESEARGVRLDWQRPAKSNDGMALRDLLGFLVERESPAVGTFEVIADIPVADTHRIRPQQDFSFVDSNPPAGSLRYRVRAYASDGQIGRASDIVIVERTGP